jgi:hypothetical protein
MKKTKNYLILLCVLFCLVSSCKKDGGNQPQNDIASYSDAADGYVTLKSGVVVEKRGKNFFLQGDILLSDAQVELLDREGKLESPEREDSTKHTGAAVSPATGQLSATVVQPRSVGVHPNENRMWAMVRYVVNPNLSAGARLSVTQAIQHIEATTNIRFYNANGQPTYDSQYGFYYPYIEFFHGTNPDPNAWNRTGNWSSVGRWDIVKNIPQHGRNDAGQWLSLQQDDFGFSVPMGVVAHEILHAIGLYHEHTRPDRDNVITVHYDRMDTDMTPGQKSANFDKVQGNYYMFGSSVDFSSIMMYGPTDFAQNTSLPVITVNAGGSYTKNRTALSSLDRSYANYFYLPYIARSDVYRELAPVVYGSNNVALTAQERLDLQTYLNNGNPYPPNCCRLPNDHTNL